MGAQVVAAYNKGRIWVSMTYIGDSDSRKSDILPRCFICHVCNRNGVTTVFPEGSSRRVRDYPCT